MAKKNHDEFIMRGIGWEAAWDRIGNQYLMVCPGCGKKKLHVDPESYKWDCKVCQESGNAQTAIDFMQNSVWKPEFNPRTRSRLASYRRMPPNYLQGDDVVGYDVTNNRYVFIVRNPSGHAATIRTFRYPGKNKRGSVRAIKGVSLGLLGAEVLGNKDADEEPVYVCEGEWDYLALRWALRRAGTPGVVVAVPGASVFPGHWARWLARRDVIACYDNDDPGRRGSVRCWERVGKVAKRIRFLHWTDDKKEGYDVNDLVRDCLKTPRRAITYILDNLRELPTGDVPMQDGLVQQSERRNSQEDLDPIVAEELHNRFDKWLLLQNHDLIDVVMGVLWSLHLPGNPLWMFVIAPPSASKSELLMPVSEWWRCHPVSNMTSRSLISGFQGAGGTDPSLLAAINGTRAAIIIKDLTPLLKGRPEERDEVFGVLRDAYDGEVVKMFGNGLRRHYQDLHFAMVAGVTPMVDAAADVSCGERFIRFRADRDLDRSDDVERALRAVSNCGQEDKMKDDLRDACVRALIRPFDPTRVGEPSLRMARLVASLAYLVSRLRAVAPVERGSDKQTMGPMAEAPPRLATQLLKFAQGLALHFDADKLEDVRVLRLVRRVALHTTDAIPIRVLIALWIAHLESKGSALSVVDLAASVRTLGSETVREVVTRYHRVGVLEIVKDEDARRKRYRIRKEILDLIRSTRILDGLPTTDVFWREDWAAVAKWESGNSQISKTKRKVPRAKSRK